jgi:S1-C subfamily serine protease
LAVSVATPSGPAALSGVRGLSQDSRGNWVLGDVLVGINGEKVETTTDVFLKLEELEPGQQVRLNLLRDEREVEVRVTLGSSVE